MKAARPIVPGTLERELRTLVANVIDVEETEIAPSADLAEKLGVDSVMRLEILVVLERTYGVKIAQEDLVKIKSLDDIRDLLLARRPAEAAAT